MSEKDFDALREEGFEALTEVETEERYFFKKEEGASIQGEVLSRRERAGDDGGFFYEILLTKKCPFVECYVRDEEGESRLLEPEDGSEVVAPVGAVVRVDETSLLKKHLHIELPDRYREKTFETFFRLNAKVPMKGGKHYWRGEVFVRPIQRPESKR